MRDRADQDEETAQQAPSAARAARRAAGRERGDIPHAPAGAGTQPSRPIAALGAVLKVRYATPGGPVDARPPLAWVLPSSTQTGPPVTPRWTAADAEGLASGRLEYAKANGLPQTGCANLINATCTAIPDPKASATLAGAASWEDSFAWTPPATMSGYYCVRGSVTDTAHQVTVVVNPFGIK